MVAPPPRRYHDLHAMLWNFFGAVTDLSSGELMRRAHSLWLTRALTSKHTYPRIPVKPAARGGFDRLCARPRGRRHADLWWEAALRRVDDQKD